jgi:hypothetical protein
MPKKQRAYQAKPKRVFESENKSDKEPLHVQFANWAMQSVVLAIVSALLSTAVMTGGAYVLFGKRQDLTEVDSVVRSLETKDIAEKRINQMIDVYDKSWNRDNVDHLMQLTKRFIDVGGDNLDFSPESARAEIYWCDMANLSLEKEQARITSLLIEGELEKKDQSLMLAEYAATLKLVGLIREAIISWATSSLEKRDSMIQEIERSGHTVLATTIAVEGIARQALDDVNRKQKIVQDDFDRAKSILHEMRIKLALVFLGMAVSVVILVASIAILLARMRAARPS